MKNICILGASNAHGVGSTYGGWSSRLKAAFYQEMYGPNGDGEVGEVYELGIPGTTLDDLTARLMSELQARKAADNPAQTYIIFLAGTNDSKAADAADNYLYTVDEFAANLHAFIHLAKDFSAHIMGFGLTPVDETRTNPEIDSTSAQRYFFTNQRIQQFEAAAARVCSDEGVQFVPLFDNAPDDWIQTYLSKDGLHPNDKGHDWIYSQIESAVRNLVGPFRD